ncbi:rab-3A-interacting protein isoform X3 [Hyalella azteca]|uniref:Rab-3A-interacting protein isoform X3 n=1 Tax=Hyalella azteca TaxID=294128 RepID=A0A8B7PAT9_HYAAZ|nr:rab-3A-interacting protein isoform X3 [Hyalella azteca]
MGEGAPEVGESWHWGVRARVTALKCHVMAAQGLTPEGQIGPAYNPDILLSQPQNAKILQQHNNAADVEAYVAAAMKSTSSAAPAQVKKNDLPSSNTTSEPSPPILCSEQVCLEMLPSESAHARDPENNEVNSQKELEIVQECIKGRTNVSSSNTDTKTANNSFTPIKMDSECNINNNSSSVNNNFGGNDADNDHGTPEKWQWRATFESDNEDDDSYHEMNGYMPISCECDETSDPSVDLPKESPQPSCSGNTSGTAGNRSSNKCEEDCQSTICETVCLQSTTACVCCNAHSNRVAELQQELQKQKHEIQNLTEIRGEVENELQELTANLFQEAHKMVSCANQRAAGAEKSLKEAKMAVDVLSGEVTALKAMVMTSTPAAPNLHLHSQLSSSCSRGAAVGGSAACAVPSADAKSAPAIMLSSSANGNSSSSAGLRLFHRGHKKSPSDFDLKYGRDITPPSSPFKGALAHTADGDLRQPSVVDCDAWEVDPVCHREFVAWTQNGDMNPASSAFMRRVYEEDINLCMNFANTTLSHAVLKAVQENELFIEELNVRHQHAAAAKCVLLDVARYCKYRFRLGCHEPHTWYYISQLARNRIIAVCDFLNYLRYIKQGLVKSSAHEMYWEVGKLRRQMAMARLGF